MPVVFYLDFVAMRISHRIIARACKREMNLLYLEKHTGHCEKGERFWEHRHNKG